MDESKEMEGRCPPVILCTDIEGVWRGTLHSGILTPNPKVIKLFMATTVEKGA